jgi:hypothetical protein
MRPRTRAAVTFIFVALFVVTTPLVILYTSGYGINWKRQRIQKTGIIQVETIPSDAQVLLDGVAQKKTTPSPYTRLIPDDYAVQILKRGYIPWQKKLTVKSGETTFATGISLYKDVLPRIALDAHVDVGAWSDDGKNLAYVADDGKWQEVAVLANGTTRVLLARFPHATYSDAALSWSPKGDAVLLTANVAKKGTQVLRFAADGVTATLSVHEHFPSGKLAAHWSQDGSAIIVVNAAGASSVDPANGTVSPLRVAADILDADLRGRTVISLRTVRDVDAARVVVERGDGASATTVSELPPGEWRFMTGTDRYVAASETRKNKLALIDLNDGSVDTADATHVRWNAKGTRALLWNDFQISLANLDDDTTTLITRLGTVITDCAWAPAEDGVIYGAANTIAVAEFDNRDRRVVADLVHFEDVGAFAVDAKSRILRFVGAIGKQRGVYERDL